MRLRALGHEYGGASVKLCRHGGKCRLGAALCWARLDNFVDANKQQWKKTGLRPAGKQIITDDGHAVMFDHLRLDHRGFAMHELRQGLREMKITEYLRPNDRNLCC